MLSECQMSSLTLIVPAGTASPDSQASEPIFQAPLAAKLRLFVLLTGILGAFVIATSVASWESADLLKYVGFLLMAVFSSGMRISVPGMPGTLSLNFVSSSYLVLVDWRASETVLLGTVVTLVQCLWDKERRGRPAQVIFNTASDGSSHRHHPNRSTILLVCSRRRQCRPVPPSRDFATLTLFLTNTLPVALAISLADGKKFGAIWRECYFWSLPYYLGGAAVAKALSFANTMIGWPTVLLTGPVLYLIYRSYRLYLQRLEDEKKHVEEVSSLLPPHY